MSKFSHDSITPYQDKSKEKKEQVAEMFNNIALKYDFLNRFLSMGIDIRWRKKAIKKLISIKPQLILDVATGTGDFALLEYQQLQPEKIIGIDISKGMLDIGREKITKARLNEKIHLQIGDSEQIPFDDNSFDAVTAAFGVRNFQHLEKGIKEMFRVLKPNGKVVIIEFSRPKNKIFKALYSFYMDVVTPNVGKLFSRNKDAYQYLNKSVKAFPERKDFTTILDNAGFKNTTFEPLGMGICCIYTGYK